jgi:hypothetical protein
VFNSWLIFPCVGALAVDGIPGPCHLDQAAAGPQTTLTARHSLADYCDEVARPALLLAQKDVEQDILDEGNAKSCAKPLTASSRTLPTNIGLPKEKHMLRSWPQPPNCRCWTGANLALSWRSDAPLVSIGVRAELDELLRSFWQPLRKPTELGPGWSARKRQRRQIWPSSIFRSGYDLPLQRRHEDAGSYPLCGEASEERSTACQVLGVWSAIDKSLAGLKEAVNADCAARSFYRAATIVLEEATATAGALDRSRILVGDKRINKSSVDSVKLAGAGE